NQQTQRLALIGAGGVGVAALALVAVLLSRRGNRDDGPPIDPPPADTKAALAAPIKSSAEPVDPKTTNQANIAPARQPENDLPSEKIRNVARYVSTDKEPPSVLLQRQGEQDLWGRLRPGDPIQTGFYLVSLPGYRSKVYLESGVRMVLWGNV